MISFDIMEPANIWKFNTVACYKTKAINKEEFLKDLVLINNIELKLK